MSMWFKTGNNHVIDLEKVTSFYLKDNKTMSFNSGRTEALIGYETEEMAKCIFDTLCKKLEVIDERI